MNIDEQLLFELIKNSQFGSGTVSDSNCDWNAVYDEAVHQSVLGLIADEVPEEVKKSDPKWNDIVVKQAAYYVRYLYSEDQLKAVLDKAGIPFVILKGNAAAIYYKEPYKRAMGDIDFLVSPDLYEIAQKELLDSQYKLEHEEDSNDRHVGFVKQGMIFELHRKFSHSDIDIEDYLSSGMRECERRSIDGSEFPMLPRLANGLVLLDHMRSHLKSGLGLRQVIDWMMYVNAELNDEFWNEEFSKVVEEKRLDTLAIVTTRMCQIYIGLPETITWCKDADERVCEQLMENLLASGNFGRKQGKGSSVETVSTSIKRKGLFRWLQYAGEYNWEAYHKHHWLKPFCWFYQIFRYAKQGFKSGRSREELSGDLNRSEQRYELLKKLGIE